MDKKLKVVGMLKLTQLGKVDLLKRQMNDLKGTNGCTCGCHYANSGGSSTCDNGNANQASGLTSPGGGSTPCPCTFSSYQCAENDFW